MPDAYVKQTWIDGLAGGTPISAARLAYIEDGIENATVEDGTLVEAATLTTDADLLTRTGGVPARITRPALAADAAFADIYALLVAGQLSVGGIPITANEISGSSGEITALYIPAVGFAHTLAYDGVGATLALINGGTPALTFADTSDVDSTVTTIKVPSTWTTMHIDVHWAKLTAASGNVVFQYRVQQHGDGITPNFGAGSGSGAKAVPATQYQLATATVASNVAVNNAVHQQLVLGRNSLSGSDNFAGTIAIEGVMLRKAS